MEISKIAFSAIILLSSFSPVIAAIKPPLVVVPANTLKVTPAGTALGFTLTPIITGIPTVSQPWGTQGASSAIASKSGDILVSNTDSDELRVYSNSDKAKGSILKSKNQVIGLRSTQLTSMNGIIYGRVNVTTSIGDIIQLNDNGTTAKTIATNIPHGYPIVAAPALNSLFFGSDLGNAGIGQNGFYLITAPNGGSPYNSLTPAPQYYQISSDPIGGTFDMYFDNCSQSIYAEYASNLGRFPFSNMGLTQNLGLYIAGGPWDGSVYGIGKIGGNSILYGKYIINNRYDTIILNTDTNERTTILSGGNYIGQRVSAHPDGSLLITSGNTVFKLRCGAGCSFL